MQPVESHYLYPFHNLALLQHCAAQAWSLQREARQLCPRYSLNHVRIYYIHTLWIKTTVKDPFYIQTIYTHLTNLYVARGYGIQYLITFSSYAFRKYSFSRKAHLITSNECALSLPRSTNLMFLEIRMQVYSAMWKRVIYVVSSWNSGCLYLIELGHLGEGPSRLFLLDRFEYFKC
jgi:hypothetical protein